MNSPSQTENQVSLLLTLAIGSLRPGKERWHRQLRTESNHSGGGKPLAASFPGIREREDQVFLGLTLVIGMLTGLSVVAFIVLTEHLGMRLYPVGSAIWRRILIPVAGLSRHGIPDLPIFPGCPG